MVLLAGLIGVLIGISLGSLGGGGSILAVPALVYVLDRPIQEAVPTSLLVVAGTSAAGVMSHLRAGRIPWRTAAVFAFTGVGGSFLGAYVNHRLSEDIVLLGFVVLMAGAATAMLRRAGVEQSAVDEGAFNDPWRERLTVLLGAGAGVGFLTGLFGVAGGIVIVPTLVLVLDFSMRTAVGTSLLIVVINSAAGFLAHLGYGGVDSGIAASFMLGGLIGSVGGERLSERVSAGQLTRWFAYLMLAVAVFVLVQVTVWDGRAS